MPRANLDGTKQCSTCENTKSISMFNKDLTKKDGLSYSCRDCRKRYRQENSERGIWRDMIRRCHDPNHINYELYGARGIKVSNRWRDPVLGYANFLSDMGPRPGPDYQLHRKAGKTSPYSPKNCQWITIEENMAHRSSTRWIKFEGKRHCFTQLHRKLTKEGRCTASRKAVLYRLQRGWPEEKAFLTPPIPINSKNAIAGHAKRKKAREAAEAVEFAKMRMLVKKMMDRLEVNSISSLPHQQTNKRRTP